MSRAYQKRICKHITAKPNADKIRTLGWPNRCKVSERDIGMQLDRMIEKIKNLFQNKLFSWFYLGVVLVLIALPIRTASQLNHITIIHLRGDYFIHLFLFMPWSFFQQQFKIKALPWLLLGFAFAAGTEGLQYFVPYRTWNVNDLLANCIGITIGFIICVILKAFQDKIIENK